MNWNMDLGLGKLSSSLQIIIVPCKTISRERSEWEKWCKNKKLSKFLFLWPYELHSWLHTNPLLIEKGKLFSCHSFPTVFQRNWKGGFNSLCLRKYWMERSTSSAILCTCNKHHCCLYFWATFHATLRYQLNVLICTFWNRYALSGRVQTMLYTSGGQNGAGTRMGCLASRNNECKNMLGQICSS